MWLAMLNYSLQSCTDVCGVMTLVNTAVVTLSSPLFQWLRGPLIRESIFLKRPTLYWLYLRRVLLSWFAKGRIEMSYLPLAGVPLVLFSSKQCNKIKGESIFEVEKYTFNIWISIVRQTCFKEIASQWKKSQVLIFRVIPGQVLSTSFNTNSMQWKKALSALRLMVM